MSAAGQGSLEAAEEPAADDIVVEAANLPEVVDSATRLLRERASGVYQRGDVLVGFVDDGELLRQERPYRIVVLNEDSLAQRINRVGAVWRRNLKTGLLSRVNCPPAVARTILSERRYAMPPLTAVAEAPLVTPDGRLLLRPGYTADGLLLHFDLEQFDPRLYDEPPTPDDVDAAVAGLAHLLSGFPFVERLDLAVAIAALMTAVYRPALPTAPCVAITARAPGSGKTHLQRLFGLLATGRESGLVAWPDEEAEFRKLLLAHLLSGEAHLAIDNVNGIARSDALCIVLTAPVFAQRMLGGNDAVAVPTRTLASINGNNLTLAGDLGRRAISLRLDAGVERPEKRKFDFDPVELLKRDRACYVKACVDITRCYLASGDRARVDPFGSFEAWSRLVREPLVWAGLPDPVQSMELASELDPDRQHLEAMVVAVRAVVGQAPFDVASLVGLCRSEIAGEPGEMHERRQALRRAVEDIALRGTEISTRALGKWFAQFEGRIAAGFCFARVREDKGRTGVLWHLRSAR